jgi:hypothetical protein
MNPKVRELAEKADFVFWQDEAWKPQDAVIDWSTQYDSELEKFTNLVIQECIDKIETYRIPVGNSPAGEMACEWTYAALKDIRDDIKETFGIESN